MFAGAFCNFIAPLSGLRLENLSGPSQRDNGIFHLMTKPRVLLLAEQCNPKWPSLPVVGYKYALALADHCEPRIVTQIRNRENIEAAGWRLDLFDFIDTEYMAAPLNRLWTMLRGGSEVAWSTNMMMAYPAYVEFERQVWKKYRAQIAGGAFDLIHRITPMSPTLPSYIAGRGGIPFVLGPLNGNLDWPAAFREEQTRERQRLRSLRNLYKVLPYARRTYRRADAILAAFSHTIRDIPADLRDRIVSFPEVGFDPDLFSADRAAPPFSSDGPFEFLFAGRLVPYKVPEAAIRGFIESERLRDHRLRIIGDGPELPRLQAMVQAGGAGDRVIFDGRKSQREVGEAMRRCDAFVFPSIRELGAGVVVEAMACGALCIVTDYGAPGDLVGQDRGLSVPLQPMEGLVPAYGAAMERCLDNRGAAAQLAAAGGDYAWSNYTWDAKAQRTREVYDAVLAGAPLDALTFYE